MIHNRKLREISSARFKTMENRDMTERQRQITEEIVSSPRGQVRGPLVLALSARTLIEHKD